MNYSIDVISNTEIEKARRQLDEYQRATLARKIGQRLIGEYPSRSEREAVRRAELPPTTRAAENIHEAIYWTHKLNGAPTSGIEGGLGKANDSRTTLPVELSSDEAGVAAQLFSIERDSPAIDGVAHLSFTLDQYAKFGLSKVIAPTVQTIGLTAFDENENRIDQVMLSREVIDALHPETLDALQYLAETVERKISFMWRSSRPENVG